MLHKVLYRKSTRSLVYDLEYIANSGVLKASLTMVDRRAVKNKQNPLEISGMYCLSRSATPQQAWSSLQYARVLLESVISGQAVVFTDGLIADNYKQVRSRLLSQGRVKEVEDFERLVSYGFDSSKICFRASFLQPVEFSVQERARVQERIAAINTALWSVR